MTQETDIALAMDWGGTWRRVAVVNRAGEMLWQARERNADSADTERVLADGAALVRQALEWCGTGRRPAGLGIAAAGPVDSDSGTLRKPPNLPELDGVSLKAAWEAALGLPVYVGNDANLAALGEFDYGAGLEARRRGQEVNSLVYVTVSTGIGGGVIDRGRMLLGSRGLAAEVGHMVIDRRRDAPLCQCGNTGCLEALASGTAIARTARRMVAEPGGANSELAALEPEQLSAERVLEAADQGDVLAGDILDQLLDSLAVGFTNLLHLYNPDLLVMGGGVSMGLAEMGALPRIYAQMKRRAMSEGHGNFRLAPSPLGDAPGMLGAASLVWAQTGS